MLAQDSPVSHSFAGPIQLDGERNRPLSNQGEVKLSTFSDSAPDPGAVLPPHHGTTITDLQDLVERHDLAPFVRIALAEYLRANHLPSITYYELSLGQQSKIQSRARELQLRRKTVTTVPTKAEPTSGAMRSAQAIVELSETYVFSSGIRVRLAEIIDRETALPEMLEALHAALEELHEFNLANKYGNKPRNPELTQEAEVKIRAAIQKALGIVVPVSSGHEGAVE